MRPYLLNSLSCLFSVFKFKKRPKAKPPSTLILHLSTFFLHLSTFILQLSSFIFQPSSFISRLLSFPACFKTKKVSTDLFDNVCALLLSGGCAGLLGDLPGDSDALLGGGGGALLPGLGVGLGHAHGGADILTDGVADLLGHGVVNGLALGGVVTSVVVAGVSVQQENI